MVTASQKLCSKCGQVRPAADYSVDRRSKDGLSWPCKPCRRNRTNRQPDPSLSGEEWKPVVGYDDVYEVSNMGRVRRSRWGVATYAGRVLKLRRHRDGYSTVFLFSGTHASGRTVFVHRLVTQSFHGPMPEGMEVNHRNGDKTDNRPENLEYVTRSANISHAFATGLNYSTGVQGSHHYKAKLTEEDVAEIKRLRGVVRGQDLAQRFGVSASTISMIHRGHKWKHV